MSTPTDEERAERAYAQGFVVSSANKARGFIADAIRAAVEAEREACAMEAQEFAVAFCAEDCHGEDTKAAKMIMDAIRARAAPSGREGE